MVPSPANEAPKVSLPWRDDPLYAYVGPFAIFMLFLALPGLVKDPAGPLWRARPEYWIWPLQTLTCTVALGIWWKHYHFRPLGATALGIGLAAGLLVLALWIAPQWLLGFASRTEGFDPTPLADSPGLWWATVLMRFARLVIVVPFIEEIFWRGFLLRYFINEDFAKVPFGTFTWMSLGIVSVAFMLVHSMADYPAAFLTGALYSLVAIRTKSLGACVLAHAVTNLGLGLYIMQTRQWGFW